MRRIHALARVWLGAVATSAIVALGAFASGAPAAGSGPYALEAQALLSESVTDLALRMSGPELPTRLEKVQIKTWHAGDDEAATRNFFDVPTNDGVATLPLAGLARGDRLEIRAHVKSGPQYNVDAETTVVRRPDLTIARIDVVDDVVRTRPFDVTVAVAELGGDVGADARLLLFDGASTSALASSSVAVAAGGTREVTFRVVLADPGDHALRAVVSDAAPAEWDLAPNSREQAVYVNHYAENGVVATDHPLATEIGADVLRHGGNAFDAAAAVLFAINVVQPHFGGIGGGSSIVIRDGKTGELHAIDARETAPAATTPTTYKGLQPVDVRRNGFAVGVPGTLRAVEYLLDRWGTRTLSDALHPAIDLAEEGFPIGQSLATQIGVQQGIFQPETRAIFLNADGTVPARGEILRQPDLAKTFRLLADEGAAAFYEGEIAQAIVAAQRRAVVPGREGKMTLADLAGYTIDVERPLSIEYKGYDVYAPAAGGTSGGVVLLESLGLMREFLADPRNDGYPWGLATPNSLHLYIEAMRLAFADRDFWLGDDRYTDVPAAGLLDQEYLRARSALIKPNTAMCGPGGVLPPGKPPLPDSLMSDSATEFEDPIPGHTTHFSIIDRWGNAVVWTSTIRNSFGTGITVPGYGFLLNDSNGLFNPSPRANPVTGDPGANDAAGGKRAMGNTTPTLILKDGEPFAGTGSLGSQFIQSVVLDVVLNLIEYDLPLQQAIDAPRAWTALSTGATQLNFGLERLIDPVRAMGHVLPCAGNLNRMAVPLLGNVGSTGSFAVELDDFELLGGADRTRFPDATAVVVERT